MARPRKRTPKTWMEAPRERCNHLVLRVYNHDVYRRGGTVYEDISRAVCDGCLTATCWPETWWWNTPSMLFDANPIDTLSEGIWFR